jgi:hypothetical protein
MSERPLKVFQDFLTSKLNTRVRFPSPAPSNFNSLARIPEAGCGRVRRACSLGGRAQGSEKRALWLMMRAGRQSAASTIEAGNVISSD